MSVDVTVLYFAGCPTWQTALERVHMAADSAGISVSVSVQKVATHQDAEQLGFTGSPTIWLDGTDPFARPDATPAMACLVYATEFELAGSPTVG
jgi:hypothetical protein